MHNALHNIFIRDVTINREPAENQFKHVTIQIGRDVKQIVNQ